MVVSKILTLKLRPYYLMVAGIIETTMGHAHIRQVVTMGTFDFLIWTDTEFQCGSNSDIHLKPLVEAFLIRQAVTMGTVDFF